MCNNKAPCEVCGKSKYTYDELLYIPEDAPSEHAGKYACPDCSWKIDTGIKSSITSKEECTIESNLSGGLYPCCAPACRWATSCKKIER